MLLNNMKAMPNSTPARNILTEDNSDEFGLEAWTIEKITLEIKTEFREEPAESLFSELCLL